MTPAPSRGDIWLVDLNPVRGREQAGKRPCLIISADLFNQGAAQLVIVIPLTTSVRGIRTHVPVDPPEGGLRQRSYIKCEDVRSISVDRLTARWGAVSLATVHTVEDCLRILMAL